MWGQFLIGLIQIRPHGIAAKFGARHHMQDGHDGRLILKGNIRMPFIATPLGSGQFEHFVLGKWILQVGVTLHPAETLA